MKRTIRCILLAFTAAAATSGGSLFAGGQQQGQNATASQGDWPLGSTISFIVPAKAGGGTDLITRFVTSAWDSIIDQNIVVTNFETAEVGTLRAAESKPDGMTLTVAACTTMDNYLSGSSEVNPMDMTCIAKLVAGGSQVVFTHPDAPYSNLRELKEYAEANPGKLIAGCALGGTSQLMWIRIAKAMGDIKLTYVQSPNEADKLTNVASGSIDLGNCSLNNALDYEAKGKIKVLGLVSYSDTVGKDSFLPNLGKQYLTTAEQGFPDASWYNGYYIIGPKGISDEVVEKINASIQGIGQVDSFIQGMKKMGQIIEIKGVDGSRADFKTEWELQVSLTTMAGVKVR